MELKLGIVGCGGMGLRHAHGYIEHRRRFGTLHLAAVCDRHEAAANHVATVVESETGSRPEVFTDFDAMLNSAGLDVVDVVTDTRMHHTFALSAFDSGVHVLTEKPMGLTMAACRMMRDAAEDAGLVLSIGEQYRRDPMNRLARALIDVGALGTPRFAFKVSIGGGTALMHDTGWRALKSRAGSIIIEQGVHEADLLIYFMGDVATITAQTGLFTPNRTRSGMSPALAAFYGHRVEDTFAGETEIEIDQEDTALSLLRFASGAIGQFTITSSAHGYSAGINTVHGDHGTLVMPPSRSGTPPKVLLGDRELSGEEMLGLVPDWQLDDITSTLFDGATRLASYDVGFAAIDRMLVAAEMEELSRAIVSGTRNVEVNAEVGMAALAVVYGILESGLSGSPVALSDIISGAVSDYQNEIDAEAGITG